MKVIINSNTGESGEVADWVEKFSHLWLGGSVNIGPIMSLLGDDIRLIAPGLKMTTGRAAGLAAFQKTFDVFPDLTGQVKNWSADRDVLFIEMTFTATVGGKWISWHNVDRFKFEAGYAVERVAYFDPSKLQKAFLGSPAGWSHLLRRLRSGL